jgi:hypothetical protein
VSFPVQALGTHWGVDQTLSVTVTVTDEISGHSHAEQIFVDTRPPFPGQSHTEIAPSSALDPAPQAPGKGPQGSVRFVQPELGQTVGAASFPILALAENWGVDSVLSIRVRVSNVETGHSIYKECSVRTHSPFPGQSTGESY